MTDPDLELAAAVREGRLPAQEALAAVYGRHAERLWRYARYFGGSDEVAAEIVQDTFLRVARNLAAFEGRCRFTTWLFTVARSVAIDITTRRRKDAPKGNDEQLARVPAGSTEPMDELIGKETREAVREAVARLPENEREAVILCELQDFSIRDAGEVLGWSESRVKVTLYRGRRRLRAMLSSFVGAGS